jgi:hypothetical protein
MAIFTGTAAATGLALKALMTKLGIGAATKGAAGVAAKVASTQVPRMAMSGAFKSGLGRLVFGGMNKGQIAARLAPDVMFGGLAAATTPGDIGDKLIAGSASAIGGGLGGLALGRAAGRFGEGAGLVADMAGSIGGDYAGMMAGDALQRGKDRVMGGAGQTAYERMSAEQQKEFAEQIRQQTLAGAGLVPGVRDEFLYTNGLS